MNKTKKIIVKTCVISLIFIIGIITVFSSIHFNVKDRNVLVFQFGKMVNIKEDTGVYFTIPIIQNQKSIFVGERLYDIPTTNVTTRDKKSMICNAYVTWQIVDTKIYYQKLSSIETAQGRIDTAVYSAIKNVIGSITQDEVISGKDGSLSVSILKKITSLSTYGIEITNLEIKLLDLPNENKQSVYERMISERKAIAAQYTADGLKEANTIKSQTDSSVRQIISDAEAEAATIIAEGETQYYKIIANAYSQNSNKTEFYKFWIGLDAISKSLTLENGGTIVIDKSSPIYSILTNQN